MTDPATTRIEQVDDNPPRWMGYFTTPAKPQWRPCMHRHHTEQAAWACVDARVRALSRAERFA